MKRFIYMNDEEEAAVTDYIDYMNKSLDDIPMGAPVPFRDECTITTGSCVCRTCTQVHSPVKGARR